MNFNTLASSLRRSVRPRAKVLWTSDWVCKSCRTSIAVRPRFSSTKTPVEKPYYITTPIFYVNAAPHVGHLYTMVLTDILKRFQELKGRKAILCTGTDEHGMKIQQAASLSNEDPKEFCDRVSETFKQLAARANLSYDHFIRTTDPTHKEAVQHFWQLLQERGYIYEKKHQGWYSVSDETFYPESGIEKRLDPATGRTFMAAQETGKEVEWTAEKNYHFRLSALKEPLLAFYKQNPNFVVPASRMRDIEHWVSDGLEDLSVSRPINRLTWGIRVPDDESQTIYVWLDALVNYITTAGFPSGSFFDGVAGWPADVHVIGKDIMRFHCIYWPAFLLALDLPLPKQVLTHAHWTLGHAKMAKSTGNVVNPFFAMDRFGVDAMRFYLAHDGGISDDADYANEHIVERYKKCLSGGLGNLLQRVTGTKIWEVEEAVKAAAGGTNKYVQSAAPWTIAKAGTPASAAEVRRIIFHASEALRISAILLQPYMPSKAREILDVLGIGEGRRGFVDAVLGGDLGYGRRVEGGQKLGKGKGKFGGIFPPLAVEE
ncbi:methionyl-tRNA synthetase [Pseudogymnoascus australis]